MEDMNVSWGHYIHQLEIVCSFQIHTEHVPKIDHMLGHSISLKNLKGLKSHEVIFDYNRIRNE